MSTNPFKQYQVVVTCHISVPDNANGRDLCASLQQKMMCTAAEFTRDANAATTLPAVELVEINL